MLELKSFEAEAIRALLSNKLATETVKRILETGRVIGFDPTGSGYFLKLEHPEIPEERIVCDVPYVTGEADEITCGFLVFMENRQMLLECHSTNTPEVPDDFRNRRVALQIY